MHGRQPEEKPKPGFWSATLRMSLMMGMAVAAIVFISFRFYYMNPVSWLFYRLPASLFLICFVYRFCGVCGFRHLFASLAPVLGVGIAAMLILSGGDIFFLEAAAPLGILAAMVLIPGSLAIWLAGIADRKCHSRRARMMALACGVLAAGAVGWGPAAYGVFYAAYSSSHAEEMGRADLKVNASELKRTRVVPTLDAAMSEGTNLIWCATFELVLNSLSPQEEVVISSVTEADLDPSTYVIHSGVAGKDSTAEIEDALETKFAGAASPELHDAAKGVAPGMPMAYAYLFVNLPFEWAFERIKYPLDFGDGKVKNFGIIQYLKCQDNEVRCASQIVVHDSGGEDDFVVELKTRRTDHHLYLAKVPPAGTLAETVKGVLARVEDSKGYELGECQSFGVPLLNFDITRDFTELLGGVPLAKQQIRFRLDERGAVLRSEAIVALGLGHDIIFDGPFLIMLRYKDAKNPYLAIWVDNPEILVEY